MDNRVLYIKTEGSTLYVYARALKDEVLSCPADDDYLVKIER